jgi:hypothetical protein
MINGDIHLLPTNDDMMDVTFSASPFQRPNDDMKDVTYSAPYSAPLSPFALQSYLGSW